MSWLTNWDEAAKHPWRALTFMFWCVFLGGAVIGYFRFDRSPAWAVILGLSFGAIVTYVGARSMRDPAWVRRRRSRRAALRLAVLGGAVALAFIVGAATHSEHIFVAVFAVGVTFALAPVSVVVCDFVRRAFGRERTNGTE